MHELSFAQRSFHVLGAATVGHVLFFLPGLWMYHSSVIYYSVSVRPYMASEDVVFWGVDRGNRNRNNTEITPRCARMKIMCAVCLLS